MCTYTYDYVPCDATDYIAVTSRITYIIAVMLRTIITGWNIMLGSVIHYLHYRRYVNSLRPRLNRRPFAADIFKCIFLNENEWILPRISLKFVPKVRINNIPALVQIMAWRRPGDKPLSEPMMVSLLTHICVTRPQWFKNHFYLVEYNAGFWWLHHYILVAVVVITPHSITKF